MSLTVRDCTVVGLSSADLFHPDSEPLVDSLSRDRSVLISREHIVRLLSVSPSLIRSLEGRGPDVLRLGPCPECGLLLECVDGRLSRHFDEDSVFCTMSS